MNPLRRSFLSTLSLAVLATALVAGPVPVIDTDSTVIEPPDWLKAHADLLRGPVFDQGSWLGLTLPEDGALGLGRIHLLSDSNGYSLARPLLTGRLIAPHAEASGPFENHVLPGGLYQRRDIDGLVLEVRSAFENATTVFVVARVHNSSNRSLRVELVWEAALATRSADPATVVVTSAQSTLAIELDGASTWDGHEARLHDLLEPGDQRLHSIVIRHAFPKGPDIPSLRSEPIAVLRASEQRWHGYFAPFAHLPADSRGLAAKCVQTLVHNWRAPAGELRHDGLFPSYAYRGFHGFWAWDSWKHAAALAVFAPALAKAQVLSMFDHQNERGMIADCVFRDTTIERHNWRNTKPPLAAWAVSRIFDATLDTMFVRDIMPSLLKYHDWWYRDRDHDRNGLCEYGSTDGTRVAAAWESGMDNAVRFDSARIVFNTDGAWSLDQESVDLNSYLCAEKRSLARLAAVIGEADLATSLGEGAEALQKRIRSTFFDLSVGYFHDRSRRTGDLVRVVGPEAWVALWAGVATEPEGTAVVAKLLDPAHFRTFVPFPTLSASHPSFDPEQGYWRGPVWLDQAWLALEGLRRYGYRIEADELQRQLLRNARGLLVPGAPIHENYDPITGRGLNAEHFSWSAGSLILMLISTGNDR